MTSMTSFHPMTLVVVFASAAVLLGVVTVVEVNGYSPTVVTTSSSLSVSTGQRQNYRPSSIIVASSSTRRHRPFHRIQQDTSTFRSTIARTRLYSSQWEDEDKVDAAKAATSFEDAGQSLQKEADEELLAKSGGTDINSSYTDEENDRLRSIIRQRAKAAGLEKASREDIEEREERAKVRAANRRAGVMDDENTFGGIDLSQISSTAPTGGPDENLPAMFYEPEQDMTPEDMAEADPVGELPAFEQFMDTIRTATWPTAGSASRDIVILVVSILFSVTVITSWDGVLRDLYTSIGFIPDPDTITQPSDNLVLPDGWTDNMSEQDLLDFQNDAGSSGGSVGSSKSSLPDL